MALISGLCFSTPTSLTLRAAHPVMESAGVYVSVMVQVLNHPFLMAVDPEKHNATTLVLISTMQNVVKELIWVGHHASLKAVCFSIHSHGFRVMLFILTELLVWAAIRLIFRALSCILFTPCTYFHYILISSLVIFKNCWSFLLMYQRPHWALCLELLSSKSLGLRTEPDHLENGSASSQLLKPETWKSSLMSQLLSSFKSNSLASVLSFLPPKYIPNLYASSPPSISIATILIPATFSFWATVIISACLPFLPPLIHPPPSSKSNHFIILLYYVLYDWTVGQAVMISFTATACPIYTQHQTQHTADSWLSISELTNIRMTL